MTRYRDCGCIYGRAPVLCWQHDGRFARSLNRDGIPLERSGQCYWNGGALTKLAAIAAAILALAWYAAK